MRQNLENQRPLAPLWPDHQLGKELQVISKILDENPTLSSLVLQDVADPAQLRTGASGMSGEQVLRCALIKQMHQFSYHKLAFHLQDSQTFQTFGRLPYGSNLTKSTLHENISRIQESTWEKINQVLVRYAEQKGLERGLKVRVDATPVESEIHYPLDSQLLWDSVRVLTRLLAELQTDLPILFTDHSRRAQRRCTNIRNSRGVEKKKKQYQDLLKVTRKTASYAATALEKAEQSPDRVVPGLAQELRHYLDLTRRVIAQTERRVLCGESVPASEKVVSIFEEHTDIICKDKRETVFGHKLFLTCGKSSLILDCLVVKGNPADSNYVQPMLERQQKLYGHYPTQASFDGAFASRENLAWAKAQGVADVAFAKKRGLKIENMVRSSWIYRQLRRFRAGIEGCISTLKRVFGLDRCHWKGWAHFQRYVQLSVVAYNLIVLARLVL